MKINTRKCMRAFLNGVEYCPYGSPDHIYLEDDKVIWRLYETKIAEKKGNEITLYSGGWNTKLTKDRLRSIPTVDLVTVKGTMYLNGEEWEGEPKTIKIPV